MYIRSDSEYIASFTDDDTRNALTEFVQSILIATPSHSVVMLETNRVMKELYANDRNLRTGEIISSIITARLRLGATSDEIAAELLSIPLPTFEKLKPLYYNRSRSMYFFRAQRVDAKVHLSQALLFAYIISLSSTVKLAEMLRVLTDFNEIEDDIDEMELIELAQKCSEMPDAPVEWVYQLMND